MEGLHMIIQASEKKRSNPKDILKKDINISIGDIVTINDDNENVEAYIVKKMNSETATLCSIEITVMKDDIYVKETDIPIERLLYLGDSFINVNGFLWNVRESILSDNTQPIMV